jgi:hypothetical protein
MNKHQKNNSAHYTPRRLTKISLICKKNIVNAAKDNYS